MPKTPAARRGALFLLWSAMTSLIGLYLLAALLISRNRSGFVGALPAPDYLRDGGPLQYVSFVLPVALFFVGNFLFDMILNAGNTKPAQLSEYDRWRRISAAFITLLAVFEINILVGMVFFFLGSPFPRLVPFSIATVLLMTLALRRLREILPNL